MYKRGQTETENDDTNTSYRLGDCSVQFHDQVEFSRTPIPCDSFYSFQVMLVNGSKQHKDSFSLKLQKIIINEGIKSVISVRVSKLYLYSPAKCCTSVPGYFSYANIRKHVKVFEEVVERILASWTTKFRILYTALVRQWMSDRAKRIFDSSLQILVRYSAADRYR